MRSGLVHSMDLHEIEQMFEKRFLFSKFHICILNFLAMNQYKNKSKYDSVVHLLFLNDEDDDDDEDDNDDVADDDDDDEDDDDADDADDGDSPPPMSLKLERRRARKRLRMTKFPT